jgi:hypothetical protein
MGEEAGRKGDWGEIRFVLLAPEERTASLPADTRRVPLEARLKGFLRADARVGEEVEIETVLGRRATGTLTGLFPPPGHTFGRPVPELLSVGRELRALLAESAIDDA